MSMTLAEARAAARLIAHGISSGDVDPYEGARKIWKDTLERLHTGIPDDLWPFKSNASAIEDCLWDAGESGADHSVLMARCREAIVRAAQALVRSTSEK
jgi:hypothetical protein